MTGLPPAITAATGIDALTHAVESFIGNWATPFSDGMVLSAVSMIFENLRTAYSDGKNLAAREKMAGLHLRRFCLYPRQRGLRACHCPPVRGLYHTPHGLANAIMLPHVLRYSRPAIVPGWRCWPLPPR